MQTAITEEEEKEVEEKQEVMHKWGKQFVNLKANKSAYNTYKYTSERSIEQTTHKGVSFGGRVW